MAGLGAGQGRDAEATQNESPEERPPSAHAAGIDDILVETERGEVVLLVLRPVFDIGFHRLDITPAVVGGLDVVGMVIAEHLAPPGQHFIGFVAVADKPAVPDREILEAGVQFAGQIGLLVMQIPLHRIDGGRGIGPRLGIALDHRHGVFQTRAEREALEDVVLGPRARLLDVGEDLHGLAVFPTVGAGGDDHLLHQVGIGQQLLQERFLFLPLLGELGQAAWRGLGQDDELHQLRVQLVAGQERVQLSQHRLGRGLGSRHCLFESLLGGSAFLGSRVLVLALGLGMHRLAVSRSCRGLGLIGFEEGFLLGGVGYRQGRGDFLLQRLERGRVFRLEFLAGLGEGHGRRLLRFGRNGGGKTDGDCRQQTNGDDCVSLVHWIIVS